MRKTTWMLMGLIALASAPARAADGAGLTPTGETWARWQGRLSFGTSAPAWHPGLADINAPAPKLNRMSLMGDYYLTSSLADGPGNALRLGRALGGGQSLDDAVRELRIAPLLQVGVSYAF